MVESVAVVKLNNGAHPTWKTPIQLTKDPLGRWIPSVEATLKAIALRYEAGEAISVGYYTPLRDGRLALRYACGPKDTRIPQATFDDVIGPQVL